MKHFATPSFWRYYRQLPPEIQQLADKSFALMKVDAHHPSLRLKKIGDLWSARIGLAYRALARGRSEGFVWVWIGHHSEYDVILKRK